MIRGEILHLPTLCSPQVNRWNSCGTSLLNIGAVTVMSGSDCETIGCSLDELLLAALYSIDKPVHTSIE